MGSVKLQTLIYAWRTLVNNSSRIFGRLRSSGAVFCPKSASSFSTSNVLFLQLLGVKARKAMMQERISAQDAVKSTPLTHEQDIPWFWLLCCSSNAGTALQGPGKGSGACQDYGQPWRHLNCPCSFPALVPHSGQSSRPPCGTVKASHVRCKLET